MLNSHIFSSIDDAYNYISLNNFIDAQDLIIVETTGTNKDVYIGIYDNIDSYITSYYSNPGEGHTGFLAAINYASSFKYRNSKDMNTIKEYINNSNITHDDNVKLENIVSKYNNTNVPIQVKQDIIDTINGSSNVNEKYINNTPHTSYLNF
jgi:hypothetical protein